MSKFKIIIFLISTITAIFLPSVHANTEHANHSLMGSHGMVLFNDKLGNIYASHLPLYRSPHDYQIIYKIKVDNKDTLNKMLNNTMVTTLPDNFDLRMLTKKKIFTINAKLYKGHFERGGKLAYSTQITFESPVLIEQVVLETNSSSDSFYKVPLGTKSTLVVHKINQQPSYDAIAIIEATPEQDNLTFKCQQAKQLNVSAIRQQLNWCGISDIKYIETQDFK